MKHRYFVFLLMLVGLALFFTDMKQERGSPVRQLYGLAHMGFFALTAPVLSRLPSMARRPFSFQFFVVMSVAFIVGGCIELVQPYFGRTAGWGDLGNDAVGGLLGAMFFLPARRSLGRGVLLFGQLAALALTAVVSYGPLTTIWDMRRASKQFPVLGDFETRFEARRWTSGEMHAGIARHGESSLQVILGTGKYVGTALKRSFGDWRSYSTFAFSLYNPEPLPLPITVSIRDEEHSRRGGEYRDRFNRTFVMEQGWNDVSIPIADIESAPAARKLELDRLSGVAIFTVDPPAPRVMYLDHVRLIR